MPLRFPNQCRAGEILCTSAVFQKLTTAKRQPALKKLENRANSSFFSWHNSKASSYRFNPAQSIWMLMRFYYSGYCAFHTISYSFLQSWISQGQCNSFLYPRPSHYVFSIINSVKDVFSRICKSVQELRIISKFNKSTCYIIQSGRIYYWQQFWKKSYLVRKTLRSSCKDLFTK